MNGLKCCGADKNTPCKCKTFLEMAKDCPIRQNNYSNSYCGLKTEDVDEFSLDCSEDICPFWYWKFKV